MGEACGQLRAGRFLVNGFPPRSASLTTVESGAGLLQFHQEPAMQAVNPSASAKEPTFDLSYLVQGLKHKTISEEYSKELSLGLCASAKHILLLAIDKADNKFGLCSQADIQGALIASAALLELAELAVDETENCHE